MDEWLYSTIICGCYYLSNIYTTYIGKVADVLIKHHGIAPMLAFCMSEQNLLKIDFAGGLP